MLPLVLCLTLGLAQSAPLPMAPVGPCARLCAEAVEFLKNGKVDDGLQKLEEATKTDPDDPTPHDFRAQVFQQLARKASPHAADYYRELAEDEAELARIAKGGAGASRVVQACATGDHSPSVREPVLSTSTERTCTCQ